MTRIILLTRKLFARNALLIKNFIKKEELERIKGIIWKVKENVKKMINNISSSKLYLFNILFKNIKSIDFKLFIFYIAIDKSCNSKSLFNFNIYSKVY